jgi:argininosuccinate synthase
VKIVLAYSGGLDTSVALHWLRRRYDAEVVAYCANLGQPGDLAEVERKAWATGASAVYVDDVRDEYLRDFVFPALRAGAAYERRYLMAAPLGRPLIARRLVEVAHAEGAEAVAHGSTGKGNDGVRFYTTAIAHDPAIRVLAPCADWELRSRDDELAYAREHGIPVSATSAAPYSMDGSLWGTSTECGVLDDITRPVPADAFQLTRHPWDAPDTPAEVSIAFEAGTPVAVDGERLDPVPLVERLNALAGEHGVGRVDLVENSLIGIKTRAVYESPGGTLLHLAHRELEDLVVDRDTIHYKRGLGDRYAELVYNGLWYSPLREALDGFVERTRTRVTGEVALRLYRGTATVVTRSSPNAMYSYSLSTHDPADRFDHPAAMGFSYVWSMPLRVRALTERRAEPSPAAPDEARLSAVQPLSASAPGEAR